ISYKVTPALFVPYFAYKRSWRTVGATMLGMGLFLLIVPSLVLGPEFNGECLAMWWHRMMSSFLVKDFVSPQEINQALGGVMTRLSGLARAALAGVLARSALLMASTSSELGGHFAAGQGHKIAQGYGMFLWAGVVLYIATACRVWVENRAPLADTMDKEWPE